MTHEEHDKPVPVKQQFTPGFLWKKRNLVFEQVENDAYAVYDLSEGKLLVAEFGALDRLPNDEENMVYLPLKRVPWSLTTPKLTFTLGEETVLWKDIKQFIYEHVDVVEPELYDVLTAWVFASYIPEMWRVVPYIFAYGSVATGKTRLLEALQAVSYRGMLGSNVSSASLFRGCDQWHPSIFLDETEIYSKMEHVEIIGLLNAGYRRGQYAWRVKNTEAGCELELFDVFGFKGLSGTEGLAKTLESRSIKIRMIKNTRPIRFLVDLDKAEEIRGKLLMWRFLMLREGCERSERFLEVPPALKFANGRLAELFQPLLTVANEGHENIVKYAKKVYEIRQLEEETSVEAMILNALMESKDKVEEKVILTKDIRTTLNVDIPKKEQFKTTTIGRIMRRLGFLPKHTRRGNGWLWNDIRVTLLQKRYLPGDIPPETASHHSHPSQTPIEVSTQLTRVLNAEQCALCGQFPVAYEFMVDGEKVKRCRNCIEQMKEQGMKFTTLTEVKKA